MPDRISKQLDVLQHEGLIGFSEAHPHPGPLPRGEEKPLVRSGWLERGSVVRLPAGQKGTHEVRVLPFSPRPRQRPLTGGLFVFVFSFWVLAREIGAR